MEFNLKQYDNKQCYEVRIGHVYIGFSYKTPVVLHDANPKGRSLKTEEYYSRTTNAHIRLLISKAELVPQDELEREIEFALARQAMRTLKERLNYGRTSIDTPDQSPSGVDSGSSVLRELGTEVAAG